MIETAVKEEPRSVLIGTTTSHVGIDLLQSTCFNRFYDGLTILISIGDMATDIIVLLSYYNDNRMTLFYISLSILLLAQVGYVFAFVFAFEINAREKISDWIEKFCCCNWWCCEKFWDLTGCDNSNCCDNFGKLLIIGIYYIICLIFGIIGIIIGMIFGHFVSFILYFSEDEDSLLSRILYCCFNIRKRAKIPLDKHLSEQAKFGIKKINKHGGFILEAFMEALPQSLLQLIGMVYYEETNIISVFSILLSMTSIMTKCFVLSQGVEWKSFLFCWLCVISDFFSIFFLVSWVFLSNEYINGNFLGYFSIIGQLWIYKVLISIIPPIICIPILYILFGFWFILYQLYDNGRRYAAFWETSSRIIAFITCGNILAVLGYCVFFIVGSLLCEIFCFSIFGAFVFFILTMPRWDYNDEIVSYTVKEMLNFISNSSNGIENDRIVRILCLNYAYQETFKHGANSKLILFIKNRREEETLGTVKYKDIRQNCDDKQRANIISDGWTKYKKLWKTFKKDINEFNSSTMTKRFKSMKLVLLDLCLIILGYFFIPIYLIGRLLTVVFPYYLVWYVWYYQLVFKLQLFELIMVGVYILLQIITFIFAFFVFRTHFWLWHILPGQLKNVHTITWKHDSNDKNKFFQNVYKYYDEIQWLPYARKIVVDKFGQDIGGIIVDYLKAMNEMKT